MNRRNAITAIRAEVRPVDGCTVELVADQPSKALRDRARVEKWNERMPWPEEYFETEPGHGSCSLADVAVYRPFLARMQPKPQAE